MSTDMDAAIQRVDQAADQQWKEIALAAVRVCAQLLPELTTDDVWHALSALPEVSTHELRALGPIMIRAQKMGIIEPLTCEHCRTRRVIRRSRREDNDGRWDVTVYRPGANA